jgi:hypothetical protein
MDQGDDVTAIEYSAAFDGKTCPACAYYDGQQWEKEHVGDVKIPPLHPNCRCTLLAVNSETKEFDEHIADAENFEKLAKERHDADPKTKKSWDDLSWDTKQKKRYDEMKRYEKETGKPARIELKDANFQDYLRTRDEKFQRQWLGDKRYEMWKNGELTLEQIIKPDNGYRKSIKDLEDLAGKKTPLEKTAETALGQLKDENEKLKAEIEKEKERQKPKEKTVAVKQGKDIVIEPFKPAFGENGLWSESDIIKQSNDAAELYGDNLKYIQLYGNTGKKINQCLRNNIEPPPWLKEEINGIREAMNQFKTPKDAVLYRGIPKIQEMFGDAIPKIGDEGTLYGFTSTSISRQNALGFTGQFQESVMFEFNVPKGTRCIPMASSKMSKYSHEKEVLLDSKTKFIIKSIEKLETSWLIKADIIE